MKRVLLCAVALLLTLAATATKPVGACPVVPQCTQDQCSYQCAVRGAYSGSCRGACNNTCFCIF